MITGLRQKLARRCALWMQRHYEVACFEGIRISDVGPTKRTAEFLATIISALEMVKCLDPRRFQRIKQQINWIVNEGHCAGGAVYRVWSKSCVFDFEDPEFPASPDDFRVGWCALSLVHEATHGLIASKGIMYTPELRGRIEALCVAEEHRFLNRLAAENSELAQGLRCEFDESRWSEGWQQSPWQGAMARLRGILDR